SYSYNTNIPSYGDAAGVPPPPAYEDAAGANRGGAGSHPGYPAQQQQPPYNPQFNPRSSSSKQPLQSAVQSPAAAASPYNPQFNPQQQQTPYPQQPPYNPQQQQPGAAASLASNVNPEVASWFAVVDENRDGAITVSELQSALINDDGRSFELATCQMLAIFNFVRHWRAVFVDFDASRSRQLTPMELGNALNRVHSCAFSPRFIDQAARRFARPPAMEVGLDSFISLNALIASAAHRYRTEGRGAPYEDFLLNYWQWECLDSVDQISLTSGEQCRDNEAALAQCEQQQQPPATIVPSMQPQQQQHMSHLLAMLRQHQDSSFIRNGKDLQQQQQQQQHRPANSGHLQAAGSAIATSAGMPFRLPPTGSSAGAHTTASAAAAAAAAMSQAYWHSQLLRFYHLVGCQQRAAMAPQLAAAAAGALHPLAQAPMPQLQQLQQLQSPPPRRRQQQPEKKRLQQHQRRFNFARLAESCLEEPAVAALLPPMTSPRSARRIPPRQPRMPKL
uniref:Peflin n=1 Tax=Macrostomum lignano TaxID=282301 RepID=A0A1I8F4I0_9PLAT